MRRAGPLDAAFFGLEVPGHPLHGMAVLVLDPTTVPGGYTFARFRRFIADRLSGIPPLRQRSVPMPMGLARPGWIDAGMDIDIRDHVIRRVRTGATLNDVAAYAAGFATAPLDRSKPLWTMHVLEGLEDGHIAVVAKVHHSLMDGVAGMEFLASMFSLRPQTKPVAAVGAGARKAPNPATRLVIALPELLTMPVRASAALVGTGRAARRIAALSHGDDRLSVPRPPRMRWNGELGNRRSVALTSLPLPEVKEVSHATGTTVNDVVLSVLGGAFRSYLERRGELPDASLVAAVPVSTRDTNHQGTETNAVGNGRDAEDAKAVRGPGAGAKPANALSLVLSTLGTDIANPTDRLVVVHEAMERAKRLHDAVGADTLTAWLAVPSPLVLMGAARLYLGLHLASHVPLAANVLVSDVPGPPVPLYFGGARLLGLYPLGPIYDGVGLNVTVVSCEDALGVGLVSSPEVLDDIDDMTRGIRDELALLHRASTARSRRVAPAVP